MNENEKEYRVIIDVDGDDQVFLSLSKSQKALLCYLINQGYFFDGVNVTFLEPTDSFIRIE